MKPTLSKKAHEAILKVLKTLTKKPIDVTLLISIDEALNCLEEEINKPAIIAQRWQTLTDQEIDTAWRSTDYTVPYHQFRIDVARAVEEKLKEKNAWSQPLASTN